jgi:trk system potassium uptake protein TrkH
VSTVALAVNIALGIALYLRFGALGVVIATVVAESLRYLVFRHVAASDLGSRLIPRALLEQIAAGLGMYLVVELARSFVTLRSWIDLGVIVGFGAVISAVLLFGVGLAETPANVGPIPGNFENALRQGLFQVIAIVTTTGYASMDVNAWDASAQTILLFAYFLGGSTGSAAGSIKIVRWVLVKRAIGRSLFTSVHPEAIRPLRLAGAAVDEGTIRDVFVFVLLFLLLFALSTVVIYLDSLRTPAVTLSGLDAMSVAIATLGNVGPGFGVVGPMNSFLPFSDAAKLYMVFLMWIGRLEVLSVLVVLTPSFWRW